MALAREYYPSEVMTILRESDHRNSPFNGAPGHCLSKHVLISTAGLVGRHGGGGGDVPVRKATAFKNFQVPGGGTALSSDMALVVTHVLNSPHGQAALASMDAGTNRRVSIVGQTPTQLFGSAQLGDIAVRQSERIGSANAFNHAPAKQHGVTHNENLNARIQGGAMNMWVLVDRIDANNIHIHTASPCEPTDPARPIGWTGTP